MREYHKDNTSIFRKMFYVKKALKKAVIAAIDKLYIKELRYLQTDKIIMTVDHIFASWLYRCGEFLMRSERLTLTFLSKASPLGDVTY